MKQADAKLNLNKRPAEFRLRHLFAGTMDETSFAGRSQKRMRLLYAAVLASVIKADSRIQADELACFADIATQKLVLPDGGLEIMAPFITQGLNEAELSLAAETIRQHVPIEHRTELVTMMWNLAMSDNELHPREVEKIEIVARLIGVSDLRTLVEKTKVLSRAS